MDELRVLIADDHPLFLHGVRALIGVTPGMTVVGEATSGHEAVARATELHPDVILMDIKMPGCNGIEATRAICAAKPEARVLIVTMFEDDASVFAAMRAGARGYVLKSAAMDDILRAVHAVARGEAIFSPSIATRMLDFFGEGAQAALRDPTPGPVVFPELTAREREILDLVARGANNGAIAERLVLSPQTVRNYISTIFSKLHVADRAQAIIRARDAGLGGGG